MRFVMTDYDILNDPDDEELTEKVKKALAQGWEVYGFPYVTSLLVPGKDKQGRTVQLPKFWHYQAVVQWKQVEETGSSQEEPC